MSNLAKPLSPTKFWLLVAAALLAALWLFSGVLAPFITGLVLAYLLNPVVVSLSHKKFPRWLAASLILCAFILVVGGLLAVTMPLLAQQLVDFANALPNYIATLRQKLQPYAEQVLKYLKPQQVVQIQTAISDQAGTILDTARKFVLSFFSGGLAVVNVLSFLVITPIVAFYSLCDWPSFTAKIDNLWPRHHVGTIKQILADCDSALGGFIRGQLLVCVALGCIYALGLSLIGLDFGLGIGFAAGIFSFIPYVGSLSGFVASLIVGTIQFGDWQHLALIVGVFVIGQSLEGYVLTPKLVGERVGLHPLWLIFAVMAGASLFGFLGMLLAVPVAAICAVLLRFALKQYQQSRYYQR